MPNAPFISETAVESQAADSVDAVLPWLAALAMVFLYVPTERIQGPVQRIFYFHLPAAWMAFLGFFIVAGASAAFLWQGRRAAEVGMLFCSLVLLTGPLWARPIWGVWWTWDPRLTMTLVLWLIYAAYVLLRPLAGDTETVARYAAVLGIVGVIDIPILYVSIRLWRGIHPTVEQMAPEMALTLLVCTAAFVCLFTWLLRLRLESLRLSDEVHALRQRVLLAG